MKSARSCIGLRHWATLLIDDRAGSRELIAPLRVMGVPVEETRLAYGDAQLVVDSQGGPLLVGVEYKKLPDLLACVRSGRFADQLRGMRDSYAVNWLLIEGEVSHFTPKEPLRYKVDGRKWREADARLSYTEMATWVMTMSAKAGVLVWQTPTQEASVVWLRGLHLWCTSRDWEEHRADSAWYSAPLPSLVGEPPLVQRVAAQLPGVGITRSIEVAKRFATVKELACALPSEWVKIPGIGKGTAAKIVKAVNGSE